MNQQSINVVESTPLQQLKARVELWRGDASKAFTAVRHDLEQVKKLVRNLHAKSELRAYVQGHLIAGAPAPKAGARPALKRTARVKGVK